MGLFLPLIPLLAVVLLLMIKPSRLHHAVSILASAAMLLLAVLLTGEVMRNGQVTYAYLNGFFYLDALSVIVLDIVLVIGFMVSIYSVGYLKEEIRAGKIAAPRLRLYYILTYLFIFTMILALTVKNIGLMWIAIEATTLASAFLVGFINDKHAVEAAWKYIIICSVGIAIALLGIILLHLSSLGVLDDSRFLDWTALYGQAQALESSLLRPAFIFILIGFGTKAGLAPMHTWLPDAYTQSPAPVSALLSGVLINSAMYAIIRCVAIINRNQGNSDYCGTLLIGIGLVSIATAAVFVITQKDYKRLLAYSSVEHMGIIAVAIGLFTPLSVFGALLHIINHSLTKSMLFLASGNILQKFKSKQIDQIKGILTLLPLSGTAFFLGLFAIAGMPPFSIFTSEFSIMAALFSAHRVVIGTAFVLLLAIIFAGVVFTLFPMFFGEREENGLTPGETNLAGTAAIAVLLAAIALSGLLMPQQLLALITQAQNIILGV
jgi:hydrogenase-4 component F